MWVVLAGAILPGRVLGDVTNVSLLTFTNSWRYVDAGTNMPADWNTPAFVDDLWTSKRAVYYTDKTTLPAYAKTLLATNTPTYYFRAHFRLNATAGNVTLSSTAVLDDGAIVYLNGVEVLRVGMPDGAVDFTTAPTRSVNNSILESFTLPSASLVSGDNVVAVELHRDLVTESNAAFALSLNAEITYTNSTQMGVRMNEVLASARTVTNSSGASVDWVELHNPSTSPVDVSDMSLAFDQDNPRKWVFPAGSIVPAQGYLVVEYDNNSPISATNTGSTLKANGDSLYLYERPSNGGWRLDALTFGLQIPDFSIGRVPNGTGAWVLNSPTRGVGNSAAAMAPPSALKINEWLAHSTGEGDWVELYNSSTLPVALGGLYFSQDPVNEPAEFQIAALSFIGTGKDAYLKFIGDKLPELGLTHLNFRLSSAGDTIAIVATNALTVLESVTFGDQTSHPDISEGRFPDGAANIVVFTDSTSPEKSNYLPIPNVLINEALTHTDPPLEDAIELYNPTDSAVDISGWFLSNDIDYLKMFRIPNGTVVPARGYKVIYEYQFNGGPGTTIPFTLNSAHGDSIRFSQADALGNLTSYRTDANFGSAENGVSFGLWKTSEGYDFTAMTQRTFGVDNPTNVTQFRLGTGLTNAVPKVGPIVINEIMYHPPSVVGTNDNVQDEYIELLNITTNVVLLYDPDYPTNTWRFVNGVDYIFPTNQSLAAKGVLLVVSFDPATNAANVSAFRTKYGVSNNIPIYGPYGGKLNNLGESVELDKPDPVQLPPHPDAGYVPYIRVDKVRYSNVEPWYTNADGGGFSLQRRIASGYGNELNNWTAAATSAGKTNNQIPIAPSISVQPVSLVVTQGVNGTFKVTSSGSPLKHQWRFNGVAISGATATNLVVTNSQAASAGSYTVVVTNFLGAVTSSVATLTVRLKPSITQQPVSVTNNQGTAASFTVVAGGDPTLYYQWRLNGTNVAGATSASYNIASTVTNQAGSYTVVVTNTYGSITSAVATLTVRVPPFITQQPVSVTATQGMSYTFRVTAGGATPLAHQWYLNGTKISGATATNYVVASAQATNAGDYTVVITNLYGSVTSAVATLSLHAPPVITQQPVSLIGTQGLSSTFTVGASGDPTLLFQWRLAGTNVPGANSQSYTIASVQTNHAGSYSVVVSNSYGSATSSVVTLTVRIPPYIILQPVSLVTTQGNSPKFFLTAGGDPTLGYKWLFNGTNISGASATNHTVTNAQSANAGNYQAVVTNLYGSVTSAVATLTVHTAPVITQQPVSLVGTQGHAASFSVAATGDPAPNFQWRLNGAAILDATNTEYSIASIQTNHIGSYTVVASNFIGSVTSVVATLTIPQAPVFSLQPLSLSVTQGATATFTATASGATAYQWRFNGNDLPGANSTTLTKLNVQVGDSGSYTLVASNSTGATLSSAATLAVVRPLRFDGTIVFTNQFPSLQISGPTLTNYTVQFSTDLVNWTTISTSGAPAGAISFTDTNSAAPYKFYRVLLTP